MAVRRTPADWRQAFVALLLDSRPEVDISVERALFVVSIYDLAACGQNSRITKIMADKKVGSWGERAIGQA